MRQFLVPIPMSDWCFLAAKVPFGTVPNTCWLFPEKKEPGAFGSVPDTFWVPEKGALDISWVFWWLLIPPGSFPEKGSHEQSGHPQVKALCCNRHLGRFERASIKGPSRNYLRPVGTVPDTSWLFPRKTEPRSFCFPLWLPRYPLVPLDTSRYLLALPRKKGSHEGLFLHFRGFMEHPWRCGRIRSPRPGEPRAIRPMRGVGAVSLVWGLTGWSLRC